jgi:hypothetical protein
MCAIKATGLRGVSWDILDDSDTSMPELALKSIGKETLSSEYRLVPNHEHSHSFILASRNDESSQVSPDYNSAGDLSHLVIFPIRPITFEAATSGETFVVDSYPTSRPHICI